MRVRGTGEIGAIGGLVIGGGDDREVGPPRADTRGELSPFHVLQRGIGDGEIAAAGADDKGSLRGASSRPAPPQIRPGREAAGVRLPQ